MSSIKTVTSCTTVRLSRKESKQCSRAALGTRDGGGFVCVLSGGQEAEYCKYFCKILRHSVSGFIVEREWIGWCDYTVGGLRGDIQGS